jgi:nicotinate-nucleotide adenylyltransferase
MGRMSEFRKIGYMGGTYDPPHLGHEMLALEAYIRLGLDRVEWLITPQSPHKIHREISPIQYRLDMLRLVTDRVDEFTISSIDLQRPPPYYAADTVELIKEQRPAVDLVYIIGEDSLVDLPGWYQPERFLAGIDQLVVAPRPGFDTDLEKLDRILPGLKIKTHFLTGFMMDISSSLVRERIKAGKDIDGYLIKEVIDYIHANQLYQ